MLPLGLQRLDVCALAGLHAAPPSHPLPLAACAGQPPHTDYAEDADTFRLPLLPGDLVVMGSDGLLDNVFMDQIAQVVGRGGKGVGRACKQAPAQPAPNLPPRCSPDAQMVAAAQGSVTCVQETAAALAQLASTQANDDEWESPYTQEALQEGIGECRGHRGGVCCLAGG